MIAVRIDAPMPKCCINCMFCISSEKCLIKNIRFGYEDNWIVVRRPNWCPLEEVFDVGIPIQSLRNL